MNPTIAQSFVAALSRLEQTGEHQGLVSLFSDTAELTNVAMTHPVRGKPEITRFWKNYCSLFQKIATQFEDAVITDRFTVLPWKSTGLLSSGKPFQYQGVTILETKNDRVIRFRAYYDSSVFYGHTHASQRSAA